MLKKSLVALALGGALIAHAQAPSTPAASPAKKALIARILKDQQPAIEGFARNLVLQPVQDVTADARNVLATRVPKDKQDEVAKGVQADLKKYIDEAAPIAQRQAVKIAPATVGAVLNDKFSEDELRQLAAMLESPIYSKYEGLLGEMNSALANKLVADTRAQIEPKVHTMEESVAKRLGITTSPTPESGAARPPAKPTSR